MQSDEFNPLCHNCPDVSICCNLRLADTPAGTCASSHVADDLSQNWRPLPSTSDLREKWCGPGSLRVQPANSLVFFPALCVWWTARDPASVPPLVHWQPSSLIRLSSEQANLGHSSTDPIERASHRKHSQILTSFSRHTHMQKISQWSSMELT